MGVCENNSVWENQGSSHQVSVPLEQRPEEVRESYVDRRMEHCFEYADLVQHE